MAVTTKPATAPQPAPVEEGSPTILVFDFAEEEKPTGSPAPDDVRAKVVDAPAAAALQLAQDTAAQARQATAVPQPAPTAAAAQPLRVLFALTLDEPPTELELTPEHVASVVVHCYVSGGWVTVNRLGLAIFDAIARGRPAPEAVDAYKRGIATTEALVSEFLPRIAMRAAEELRARLAKLTDTVAHEVARYAIVSVDAQPAPQGGGARGGQEGGSTQGTGGGPEPAPAQAPGRTYRAPEGKAGDAARDLVARAKEIGGLADLHTATKERLDQAEHAEAEAKAMKDTAAHPPPKGTASTEPSSELIESLRTDTARTQKDWQEKLAAATRVPEQPAPAAAPGTAPPPRAPAVPKVHPLLPGILGLCIASKGDDRYSESNVLRQAVRYVEAVQASIRTAMTGPYFTQSLEVAIGAPAPAPEGSGLFAGGQSPEMRAAAWALAGDKPYAVEPFASDAVLTMVYRSLVAGLEGGSDREQLSAALLYRICISYWEALLRARQTQADAAARDDFWRTATSKLVAALSLVGLLFPPAAVVSGMIGVGQMLCTMQDAVADLEAAAGQAVIESVITGEGDKVAVAIATRPTAWPLFAALLPRMGAELALSVASPIAGLLWGAYQDLSTLADDEM